MKFNSTRNKKLSLDSAKVIYQGISKEGGLFVPKSFPKVSSKEIAKMANLGYKDVANNIIGKFLTDFEVCELANCINSAYDTGFDSRDIAPTVKLDDKTSVLELWHGPTCAFKDMALQLLPYLLTTSMKKVGTDKTVLILVATSGDTGKAALEGFKDVDGTKIMVFFPEKGVSAIQKLQMQTQDGKNLNVTAINGNFDDAQTAVKEIFTNADIEKSLDEQDVILSSANSINFGRLVPQIVYYFYSYVSLIKSGEIKNGDKVNFSVPTGNFGNILAAYYAKHMGLPVGKLICASNKNNILTDFIKTGVYNTDREFHITSSPSMDILVSSNLERYLYHISGSDDKLIASLYKELKETGKFTLPEKLVKIMQKDLSAGWCDEGETRKVIGDVFEKDNYLLDPHTAVAKKVADEYIENAKGENVTVIASTANPYKFSDSVIDSIQPATSCLGDFQIIDTLEKITKNKAPSQISNLRNQLVIYGDYIEKEEITKAIMNFVGGSK